MSRGLLSAVGQPARRLGRPMLRLAWPPAALLVLTLLLATVPATYRQLLADYGPALDRLGFAASPIAGYLIALGLTAFIGHLLLAAVIFWRRPEENVALLIAFTLVGNGAILPLARLTATAELVEPWRWLAGLVIHWGLATSVMVLFLFPDGRFIPRQARLPVWVWVGVQAGAVLLPGTPLAFTTWPTAIQLLALAAMTGTGAWAQLNRYRHVSTLAQKQQTKWAALGLLAAIAGPFLYYLPFVWQPAISAPLAPNLFMQRVGGILLATPVYLRLGGLALVMALTLLFPLSFAIAVLRYRLWEIDLIINRTLVYGALTAAVVALYGLLVGGLSAWLPPGDDASFVIATGLIAVLFQPLRARLQGRINRLMYGERDDPATVLARLGQKLAATAVPDALLPALVETVGQALKLPYAAVAIRQVAPAPAYVAVAVYEPRPFNGEALVLPLTHQSELVGQLLVAPRAPGESFTAAERQLLATIARQAGTAVYAIKLAADLQRSQAELSAARTAERQRLRRDLHDGLGPALASLSLKSDAARNNLRHDPARADKLLQEFQRQAQALIGEIRRLVNDLRPPDLDQLGLVSALQQQAAAQSDRGLAVNVAAPAALPPLPAAVEVAAYRIALEALTNVARHARARTCTISLVVGDQLQLSIRDDGAGLPPVYQAGVGLASMRERTAELGGRLQIRSAPGRGTQIEAFFPCHPLPPDGHSLS